MAFLNPAEVRHTNLFPTPLISYQWPDSDGLNAELRAGILAHMAGSAGEQKSNNGGWHSDSGQLEFCGAAGRKLVQRILRFTEEGTKRVLAEAGGQVPPLRMTLHAWANVNRNGAFNALHTHPGSTWSGTYYVDTGAASERDETATPLILYDSCQVRAATFLPHLVPSRYQMHPRAGLMVLFPSYLPHEVWPHAGVRARISVAFNLRREPFP